MDARLEKHRHRLRQRAEGNQLLHGQRRLGEFTDRDRRAVERERRDDDVDARAVGQTRVAKRARFVDAAAERRENLVDDAAAAFHVEELDRRETEPAFLLGVNGLVAVHHDLGDRVVLEQLLERAETDHLVDDVAEQLDAELASDRNLVRSEALVDEFLNPLLQRALVAAFEQFGVERLHQEGQQLFLELHDEFLRGIGLGPRRAGYSSAGWKPGAAPRSTWPRREAPGSRAQERRAAAGCHRREDAPARHRTRDGARDRSDRAVKVGRRNRHVRGRVTVKLA